MKLNFLQLLTIKISFPFHLNNIYISWNLSQMWVNSTAMASMSLLRYWSKCWLRKIFEIMLGILSNICWRRGLQLFLSLVEGWGITIRAMTYELSLRIQLFRFQWVPQRKDTKLIKNYKPKLTIIKFNEEAKQ